MKKFTKLFITFSFAFLAAFGATSISQVATSPFEITETVEAQSLFSGKEVNETSVAKDAEANKIFKSLNNITNIFAGLVLSVSIIMIIVGGLRYILANGEQKQAEQGKMILIYSGIGIVIALSSFMLGRLFASFQFS